MINLCQLFEEYFCNIILSSRDCFHEWTFHAVKLKELSRGEDRGEMPQEKSDVRMNQAVGGT